MKRTRLAVLLGLTFCILAGTLAVQRKSLGYDDPRALLRDALEKARDAGSYQVQMGLDQTVRQLGPGYLGGQEEWAHFEIEGAIAAPDRARFSILPGRTSFLPAREEPQEFLAVGTEVYQRAGDRWVAAEPGTAAVEVDGIGLSLLSAARDVEHLDPAQGPPALGEYAPAYRRVGFKLHSDDVTRFLLLEQGITDPETMTLARLSSPSIEGSGELWIDDAGFPARLVLNLEWVSGGAEPYRSDAASTTDYTNFGVEFPANHFNPAASPGTGVLLPPPDTGGRAQPGLWLVVALALLVPCWLLVRARSGSRRATVVVTAALVAGLLTPSLAPVAESAGLPEAIAGAASQEPEPPAPGSEFARMMEETAALASGYNPSSLSQASAIAEDQDDDGDGLPNRYELHLGTSPFAADSDYDGLTDGEEVRGVPCPSDTFPNHRIVTDPLNPDSNYDGLKDGAEYYRGQCRNSFVYGYAWHDDNDLDGVPDGLDLSPFSTSMYGSQGWYGQDDAGPDLTFETLDQNPWDELDPYPFYVEIQIRPVTEESLRWAYKHVQWPGDNKGAIQSTPPWLKFLTEFTTGTQDNSTSGLLTLVPLLQATLRESDLPSQKAMEHYGVSTTPHKDEQGQPVVENGEALYDMYIPLSTVERGGQVFAFQAKMLHDDGTSPSLTRHWRDLRFKWALLGDVRRFDPDAEAHIPSPDGQYGLAVYDEDYYLTGLQVSRQGGASMLVAAPLPYPVHQGELFDDSRISLLRAGMEAHFLTGRLDLDDIKARFDEGSGSSEEARWTLPEDWFRVKYDESMDYEHLDQAIASTTMTTTVQLLHDEYVGDDQNLEPSLIIASEQKTSTVNLDDDPTTDYLDITINSCIKPLITTRSLKLQTYRWGFGGDLDPEWEPLTLDEVLQKVEFEYAAIANPNDDYYNEELNIIKMATTAWQTGMTALQKIGQVDIQDLDKVLTDPETALELLDKNDELPGVYKEVIDVLLDIAEAGGPLAWLEAQWNKVVGVYDVGTGLVEAIGSFMDYSPETSPPSAKATSPGSEEAPGEPVDQTLLGWTETAINVLNFLATVTGWEWLGDLVDILTKVVEIYRKIRAVWDTTKAIVDSASKVGQGAAQTMSVEVGKLVKPLGLLGLIFAVGMIWLAVAMQIGDAGPSVALTLVLRAVVETVLLIVLFVLAAVFPIGTAIAVIAGLAMALSSLTGVNLDPFSALINWLFAVEVIVRTELVEGATWLGKLDMEPLEPGGGVLSGRLFRLSLPATMTMRTVNGGSNGDLNQSDAKLHIGRYTAWFDQPARICVQTQEMTEAYLDALAAYSASLDPPAKNHYCVKFYLPREIFWQLTTEEGDHYGGIPSRPGGPYSHWERYFSSTAILTVNPGASINGRLLLDVSLDVKIRHDECSKVAGCDGYETTTTSPPSVQPLYFDILPATAYGVFHWAMLTNPDPDGDGLVGFIDPNTEQPAGPDGTLCPGAPGPASWETWDKDGDGLSDKFEVEREGFDPCTPDSDGDGLNDGWELMVGTAPDDADSDDDGLSDREELVLGRSIYDKDVYTVSPPWTIQMDEPYLMLPAPAAFPNPRRQNLDGDHRKDSQEKAKLSSPNAYDALPVGEALGLSISQTFVNGGGTAITVTSSPWANDEVAGVDATFTITLPVAFSDVAHSVILNPPSMVPGMNVGTLVASEPTYAQWSIPPMTLPRTLYATYGGLPAIPSQPVNVTAGLCYTEGTVTRIVTATAPLLVNDGGPVSAFTGVVGAVQQDGGASAPGSLERAITRAPARATAGNGTVTITGTSADPQGTSQVLVCAKQTDDCDGADWQQATLIAGIAGGGWYYDFAPPADGLYYVRAYGIDNFELAGPVTDAMIIGVDGVPPSGISFDLDGTAYLSSTLSAGPPGITLTGRISDTMGTPYVSGVDAVALAIGHEELGMATVAEPGTASSAFAFRWEPSGVGFGRSLRNPAGMYTLTVGGSDLAGNVGVVSDTLRVLIDDTPPMAYGRPPQVAEGTTVALSGLADDTALVHDRQPAEPFSSTLTIADRDAQFDVGLAQGQAHVIGDVTGDLIDDVVLLLPAVPGEAPFRAGLFFGRAGMADFSDALSLDAADVVFQGEEGVPDLAPAAAGAGDVNGDGVGDLLLGEPNAASGEGRAYLILGRRGGGWSPAVGLADADWQLSVPGAIGFGGSVAAAGDVNGDGLADVLVGAAAILDQAGATWLFRGREQGMPPPEIVFYSPPGALPVPPNLAGLGDSNGDGLSDLLIASPGAEVALVHGHPDEEWPASPIGLGTEAGALLNAFGPVQTVAAAGDLNSDGLADMLIGDPEAGTPGVWVLYGRRPETAWSAAPIITPVDDASDASFVENDIAGSRLGAGLVALGDVDGDGLDDFAFGQPGSGPEQDRTAIVLTGRLSLEPMMPVASATYLITGTVAASQRSGAYLSAGDVTGDHIPDLLIGAMGDNQAYLFHGSYDPGLVAGIARVEAGLYGPVTDATLPVTMTMPVVWETAILDDPGGALTPWTVTVPVPGEGDYRVYVRAYDRAGNPQKLEEQYLGNVWVSAPAVFSAAASASMEDPDLVDQTELALAGNIGGVDAVQYLRVYNGYQWARLVPSAGDWSWESTIPRNDQRTLTFRVVARDGYGATVHDWRELDVDSRVDRPRLTTDLTANAWYTDEYPELTLTWPAVDDGNGIAGTWAVIDTISNTRPAVSVGVNEVQRLLEEPGAYYGHVRVQDGLGNEFTAHTGPFLVNGTNTPSAILPDGYLDFAGGEYPAGTLLNYDPYAALKPAALWGTWDAERLYLAYPGQTWGSERVLAVYLDTVAGGLSSTLAPLGYTHTLPFAADFAFVMGGPARAGQALYTVDGDAWTEIEGFASYAVSELGTEIVLDRAEIEASGPVQMVAYAEDDRGVWAVLPGGARPAITECLTGTVAFGEALTWDSLGEGAVPGEGQAQLIAPAVALNPAWDNVLFADQTTVFTMTISNPDLAPYEHIPLTLVSSADLVLNEVSGADCASCPPGVNRWTLYADVAAGGTQTVTVGAMALGGSLSGVFPLTVTASLDNSGLRTEPRVVATLLYNLDQGVGALSFLDEEEDEIFLAAPGEPEMTVIPNWSGLFHRCLQRVEANIDDSGWTDIADLGDCPGISAELLAGETEVWQVRVVGENGRISDPISKTVIADTDPPTVQISPTVVLSGTLAFLRGLAWDESPVVTRAPRKVEISVNGGRFYPAHLSALGGAAADGAQGRQELESTATWLFPLWLTGQDGETVQIVARAVDRAGNVGPETTPMAITLDNRGPSLTGSQVDDRLEGTISDGSGVAWLRISLDGGAHYQPVTVAGEAWSFELSSWTASWPLSFAMLRAADVWGNVTHELLLVEHEFEELYLPLILKSR